ncbi:hypothetical protein NQ315_001879 [Exocentrus adspersus]|uniref:Major facilitator superfamily (MFS) profile domain-containing protein n=1 Tax=Exocentrus adspersus TaxID=1586481 RepID=A0AAV8WC97_9CUCU|nr:hypothetical protein NQ315_001879 [Exocentrus adspersus]
MPSEKLEKNFVMKKFQMDSEIPQNNSQQELVRDSEEIYEPAEKTLRDVTLREWVAVLVLCFVNLINYMDRFTIADDRRIQFHTIVSGILDDIKDYFDIKNDKGGLLQTAFVISYMVCAPIFGYLGDRYSRRWIMAAGVFLWSITTLCGSFMTKFWWFILFRALVGVGEASYSTIAPTIISDLFVSDVRSKMLALFYFAIPVGSGLGYIVGSETAKAMDNKWQWALRVTPALGLIAVVLIIFVLEDPERGHSEGSGHMEVTPWTEDIKDIVHNRSFMFSTAGFTCVAFVAGALAWWGPLFIEKGIKLQNNGTTDSDSVSYKFGIISMISGLIGVPFGSFLAQKLRHKYHRIDAHICAAGLLISSPLVFFACIAARYSASLCFALVFFAELFLNLTWSIVADILLQYQFIYRLHCFSTSFIFGGITMVAGIFGLTLGSMLSQSLKHRFPSVDPIICGAGLILSAPFLIGTTYASTQNTSLCYVLLFFGQVSLNLNWAIVSDILLYVVLPTRRSTAEGFQLLVSHALGDAGSPYLIGVLSEAFKIGLNTTEAGSHSITATAGNSTDLDDFKSLQYALFSTCFVEVIGGLFFLITAFYVLQDKHKVETAVHEAAHDNHLDQGHAPMENP